MREIYHILITCIHTQGSGDFKVFVHFDCVSHAKGCIENVYIITGGPFTDIDTKTRTSLKKDWNVTRFGLISNLFRE